MFRTFHANIIAFALYRIYSVSAYTSAEVPNIALPQPRFLVFFPINHFAPFPDKTL
jgi:hypothetical protein